MTFLEAEEPEWTAENLNRKQGDTTLNICGWCDFRGTGTYRYNCMLEGNCDFFEDKSFSSRYDYHPQVKWDIRCLLRNYGRKDLEFFLSQIKTQLDYALRDYENRLKRFNFFQGFSEKLKLEDRPPLIDNRRDEFEIGKHIRVFIHDNWFTNKELEEKYCGLRGRWARGIVVQGYRSGDGCVSFVLDNVPESRGKGWGGGVGVPTVMLEEDYQYFKSHLDYWSKWRMDAESKTYNGVKIDLPMMLRGEEDKEET